MKLVPQGTLCLMLHRRLQVPHSLPTWTYLAPLPPQILLPPQPSALWAAHHSPRIQAKEHSSTHPPPPHSTSTNKGSGKQTAVPLPSSSQPQTHKTKRKQTMYRLEQTIKTPLSKHSPRSRQRVVSSTSFLVRTTSITKSTLRKRRRRSWVLDQVRFLKSPLLLQIGMLLMSRTRATSPSRIWRLMEGWR